MSCSDKKSLQINFPNNSDKINFATAFPKRVQSTETVMSPSIYFFKILRKSNVFILFCFLFNNCFSRLFLSLLTWQFKVENDFKNCVAELVNSTNEENQQ